MRPFKREVTTVNESRYCLIPFFIAEPYGIEKGSRIEFDTNDPETLVIRIRKERKK